MCFYICEKQKQRLFCIATLLSKQINELNFLLDIQIEHI